MKKILILFFLFYIINNQSLSLSNAKDKKISVLNLNRTEISIYPIGSKITIFDKNSEKNINLTLVSINEIFEENYNYISREYINVNDFSKLKFEINLTEEKLRNFDSNKINHFTNLDFIGNNNNSFIGINLNSFYNEGNFTDENENVKDFPIKKEDFLIEFFFGNLKFCRKIKENCPIKDKENSTNFLNSEFFDFTFSISSNEIPLYNPEENLIIYNDLKIFFSNYYKSNETYLKFPNGEYPKIKIQENNIFFTLRFKIQENDSLISYTNNFFVFSKEKIIRKSFRYLIAIIITVTILIFMIGIVLYYKKNTKRNSSIIETI